MFHHILIPLDGTTCAEQALAPAAQIAQEYHCSVTLLRVIDIMDTVGLTSFQAASIMQEVRVGQEKDARDYISRIRTSSVLANLDVDAQTSVGDVASVILNFVQSQKVDLVVMSRRTHTIHMPWLLGSVAQKVTRHCRVPVLLLHEDSPLTLSVASNRTFTTCVGLDGSALAETSIQPALAVTAAYSVPQHRNLHLIRVIAAPDPLEVDYFQSRYNVDLQEAVAQQVKEYLEKVAKNITETKAKSLGVTVTWSAHIKPDVAKFLIEYGKQEPAKEYHEYDLLALATHGRSGITRWSLGSVSERVLNSTTRPLLIVHANSQA